MLLTRAHALVARGRPAEALIVAHAGAAAALSGGVHAHALALAACSRLALGDRREAVATAERARREATEAGDLVAVCFALHVVLTRNASSMAGCTTADTPLGVNTVTATYSGDPLFAQSTGTTTAVVDPRDHLLDDNQSGP